jgi:hypothetical protein
VNENPLLSKQQSRSRNKTKKKCRGEKWVCFMLSLTSRLIHGLGVMFQEYLTAFEVTSEEILMHLRSCLSGTVLHLRLCVEYFTECQVMYGVFYCV